MGSYSHPGMEGASVWAGQPQRTNNCLWACERLWESRCPASHSATQSPQRWEWLFHRCPSFPPGSNPGFSNSAPLTFWVGWFFVLGGTVLCTRGCLAASLAPVDSVHILPPSCDNVPCGIKITLPLLLWELLVLSEWPLNRGGPGRFSSQEDKQWRGEWYNQKEHGVWGNHGFESWPCQWIAIDFPTPSSFPVFCNQKIPKPKPKQNKKKSHTHKHYFHKWLLLLYHFSWQ